VTSSKESPATVVVPVVEERAHVETRTRESDRVTVRVSVETHEEAIEQELRDQSVEIERVAIGREISEIPPTREQDGVLIVPLVEERLVVQTKLILKEELHIRRVDRGRPIRETVRLRREVAQAERPAAKDWQKGETIDVNDE
jgi:stress response protein YsnF